MLQHRATSALHIQYIVGINDDPGNHAHIVDIMQQNSLQLADVSQYEDCYTFFIDEEQHGQSFKITSGKMGEVPGTMKLTLGAQLIVPKAIGRLILMP